MPGTAVPTLTETQWVVYTLRGAMSPGWYWIARPEFLGPIKEMESQKKEYSRKTDARKAWRRYAARNGFIRYRFKELGE